MTFEKLKTKIIERLIRMPDLTFEMVRKEASEEIGFNIQCPENKDSILTSICKEKGIKLTEKEELFYQMKYSPKMRNELLHLTIS
jgi:hypothetical protein